MAPNFFSSELILIITAATLVYVAYNDFQRYEIRNELVIVLAVLFFVHALVSGRWVNVLGNVAFAVMMFICMLFFYSRRLMGGGDVKLLSVAFLWVGIGCALPFAVLLLVCAGIHAIAAKLGRTDSQNTKGTAHPIPFAPSIAAALVGIFILGCLEPVT
jgi:prepilin peptidase CpaA